MHCNVYSILNWVLKLLVKGISIKKFSLISFLCVVLPGLLSLSACGKNPWNDPYPESDSAANILYAPFDLRPKHLDPAQSYSAPEINITAQIYEPPLQYHFLKRPYELIPLAATAVPKATYIDKEGNTLPENSPVEAIAYTYYDIQIKPGIKYQPHVICRVLMDP